MCANALVSNDVWMSISQDSSIGLRLNKDDVGVHAVCNTVHYCKAELHLVPESRSVLPSLHACGRSSHMPSRHASAGAALQ